MKKIILIYPPLAKPGEPPAGIARLAGTLRSNNVPCLQLDANIEGLLWLSGQPLEPTDTWSRRACNNINDNLDRLRDPVTYSNLSRYKRAVADVNKVISLAGLETGTVSLVNYQDRNLSPQKSKDLLKAAENFEDNIFYLWFNKRLDEIIAQEAPHWLGFSLNYLSQALTTFAMLGFVKKNYPQLSIVMGGGLTTSWLRNHSLSSSFSALIDHMVSGKGEAALLGLLGVEQLDTSSCPDYSDLPVDSYLSPGPVLPYATSHGCYWNKCSFCPEKAEGNEYVQLSGKQVVADLKQLQVQMRPLLIHFLDNGIRPAIMRALIENPPGANWYGFARVSKDLTDLTFCQELRRSGCVMLKLGIESGAQEVLDAMEKGVQVEMISAALKTLQAAGIATYVYLLFGTPHESPGQAQETLDFIALHHEAVTFLNLAVFNMPLNSPDAVNCHVSDFYEGDLALYNDFIHPLGWQRPDVRRFLDKVFKRHPLMMPILQRDPPLFTSNHAPFFCGLD